MATSVSAGKVYTELLLKGGAKFATGLNKAKAKLSGFATGAMQSGRSMTMVGLAAALPFTAGIKVFADFEQQMANVSTMVDDVATHMPALTKGVEDLALESGESTKTLSDGLYDILSASIPAEKALDVLAVSARAAKAGLTDTGVAADAITTILNSYGLAAEKAGSVSDLLFQIVKRGKITFPELASSIGMVASTAAAANVPLEEMGAVLAVMTRKGVKGQNAITALNAIISGFLSPSSEAAKYAKTLGFEMSSATIKSEGLQGVFQRISKLPADAVAKLFPNIRALRGVLPALKSMGEFTSDIGLMANRAGATDKAYEKMANTLDMLFSRVKQAGLAAFKELGAVIEKPVIAGAKAIFKYLKAIRNWIRENKGLVLGIAAGAMALIGMGSALITVAAIAKVAAFAISGLSFVLLAVKMLFLAIPAIIGLMLSPIGLVLAGVAALVLAFLVFTDSGGKAIDWIMQKFSVFKQFAGETFGAIKDALLAGDFAAAGKVAITALNVVWQWGINEIMGYWVKFKAWYMSIMTKIVHGGLVVVNNLRAGWDKAVSAMSVAIVGLFTSVKTTFNDMHGWLAKKMLDIAGVFDSSLDVEGAKKLVDVEVVERSKGDKAWLAQTKEDHNVRTTGIETKRKEDEAAIVEMADAELKAQADKYNAELAASRAKLADAKKEWKSAVAEAKAKPKVAKGEDDDGDKPSFNGVPKAIGSAMGKFDVAGSFYANIRGLSAGPAADRTAKATEDIAKNTAAMNKLMKNGKLVYS